MDAKSPLDDYITIGEAATILRCSRGAIYDLHRKGKLEMVAFLNRKLVSQQSVDRLLADELKPLPSGTKTK
jgi:excisionase family DNA binding protein